jgi:two-component system sensor histidine kinase UhpB
LDPDPVIRINANGSIVETNDVTHKVFKTEKLRGRNIKDFLPFIDINVKDLLESDRTKIYTEKINDRYYSILFRYEIRLGIAQIYFRDITEQKVSEDKLIESKTKLRDLSDHLQDLIEEERHRIAQGLHDGIGQSLSLLRMKLMKMTENESVVLKDINHTALMDSLESIITELKEISYRLKPKTLEEMGLGIALKLLVNQVSEDSGIKGEANIFGEEIRLDNKVEISLYRIVQEATNNILKYSKATNFSVQLLITSKIIRLIISDNGIGFDAEQILSGKGPIRGMGLINIKERVEHLKGQLKIESSPGNGTMIVAEIKQPKITG